MIRRAAFNTGRNVAKEITANPRAVTNVPMMTPICQSRLLSNSSSSFGTPGPILRPNNPVSTNAFSTAALDMTDMNIVRAGAMKRTKSNLCRDTLKEIDAKNDYGPEKNFNSVHSSREAKGVTRDAAKNDGATAEGKLGGEIKDHANSEYTGQNPGMVSTLVSRAILFNPLTMVVLGASGYRLYESYSDEKGDSKDTWMAQAKQARREGHRAWVEFYSQRPLSEVQQDHRYEDIDGKPIYHWRKFDNTKVVKSNSYRPGGREIEKEKVRKEMAIAEKEGVPVKEVMKRKRSQGYGNAGLYDSMGVNDQARTPNFVKEMQAEVAGEMAMQKA